MRNFFLLLAFSFCLIRVNSQTNFDLNRNNKNKSDAVKSEKEISRLKDILVKAFLQKASDSSTETYRELRQRLSGHIKSADETRFQYPEPIADSNISISVIRYNYSWNFTPVSTDSLHKLQGFRSKELDAIVSIPLYTSFHKGYALNFISFFCKLTEVIHWTEDDNNLKPIEQLPDYSRSYNLKIRKLDITD